MEIRGKVSHGVVILDKSDALPDGTVVRVEAVQEPALEEADPPQEGKTLAERFRHLIGCIKDLPPDFARNHDHYLHGMQEK